MRRGMFLFGLTLVRHGETGYNKDNVIQGQLDVPLSTTGIQQAKMLGAHLRQQQYSHVFVSDLSRAKQTAQHIVRQNLFYKECLIHDCRLRERKFGDVEGQSFKYLKQAAENAGRKITDYTPPGGETLQQFHERAVSFFQDLCQTIARTCTQCEDQLPKHTSDQSFSSANCSLDSTMNSYDKSINGNKRKGDGLDYECVKKLECSNQTVQMTPSKAKIYGEDSKVPCSNCILSTQTLETLSGSCKACTQRNVAYDSDGEPYFEKINEAYGDSSSPHQSESLKQRLSMSSSDDDLTRDTVANVLVVSHGGFIRELLRYFVEELGCPVPGGKQQVLRISPNAGLSNFTVTVEENGQHPELICHQIHDNKYLIFELSGGNSINSINNTAL